MDGTQGAAASVTRGPMSAHRLLRQRWPWGQVATPSRRPTSTHAPLGPNSVAFLSSPMPHSAPPPFPPRLATKSDLVFAALVFFRPLLIDHVDDKTFTRVKTLLEVAGDDQGRGLETSKSQHFLRSARQLTARLPPKTTAAPGAGESPTTQTPGPGSTQRRPRGDSNNASAQRGTTRSGHPGKTSWHSGGRR